MTRLERTKSGDTEWFEIRANGSEVHFSASDGVNHRADLKSAYLAQAFVENTVSDMLRQGWRRV